MIRGSEDFFYQEIEANQWWEQHIYLYTALSSEIWGEKKKRALHGCEQQCSSSCLHAKTQNVDPIGQMKDDINTYISLLQIRMAAGGSDSMITSDKLNSSAFSRPYHFGKLKCACWSVRWMLELSLKDGVSLLVHGAASTLPSLSMEWEKYPSQNTSEEAIWLGMSSLGIF